MTSRVVSISDPMVIWAAILQYTLSLSKIKMETFGEQDFSQRLWKILKRVIWRLKMDKFLSIRSMKRQSCTPKWSYTLWCCCWWRWMKRLVAEKAKLQLSCHRKLSFWRTQRALQRQRKVACALLLRSCKPCATGATRRTRTKIFVAQCAIESTQIAWQMRRRCLAIAAA